MFRRGDLLGSLYGVIGENSTFGEVVRRGDSKRKRWFRFRLHIQRPSELAFFYENRSDTLNSFEAWIRWGGPFVLVLATVVSLYSVITRAMFVWALAGARPRFADDFHINTLVFVSLGLLMGAFLFSHAKNTTLLTLPVIGKREWTVSRLDTVAFLTLLVVLVLMAFGATYWLEQKFATTAGATLFPSNPHSDYFRFLVEGCLVLATSGMVIYVLQRWVCLYTWTKIPVFVGVFAAYLFLVCLPPFFLAMLLNEVADVREHPLLVTWGPRIAFISPLTFLGTALREIRALQLRPLSALPFYLTHGAVLLTFIFLIRRRERSLSTAYSIAAVDDGAEQ